MRKPTSTSDGAGKGRLDAEATCLLYLSGRPGGPGTVLASHLIIAALDGEKTLRDVLENVVRRVGTVHDLAELAHGKMAASNCTRAAIKLDVGDPKALAATQILRARAVIGPNEIRRVRFFEITLTAKADSLSPGPKLRFFDDRDNPQVRGLRHLHREGEGTRSPVWALLEQTREREHVLATLLPSPRDEPTVNVVAWAHWLAALYDEGLIVARRRELSFKAKDLPLPSDYCTPLSRIERLRRMNMRVNDYSAVLEESVATVKRIFKIFLMVFGGSLALLIGASKAHLPFQDQARHALQTLISDDDK
jgi:hypothetical protein